MDNLFEFFENDEENENLNEHERNRHINPRIYRPRIDHLNIWNDEEFLCRFRLSKNSVRLITGLIRDEISSLTDRQVLYST